MTVYVKVKALAKRRPIIEKEPIEIDENISTSDELVAYIVRRNVAEYNAKAADAPIFPYLTDDDLEDGIRFGKLGFGDRKNENTQDMQDAVSNALTCYADGIFKLFIGDEEILPGQLIKLKENDEITFVRLTMLTGRLW